MTAVTCTAPTPISVVTVVSDCAMMHLQLLVAVVLALTALAVFPKHVMTTLVVKTL
jgi:hypothetical protein